MNTAECMGRLMSSATHDMRNVLAVIRESAGLAQDMLHVSGTDLPGGRRLHTALEQVQEQVLRGAALAESMGNLAACAPGCDDEDGENAASCDVGRVIRDFCCMAARRGRACGLELTAHADADPVVAEAAALDIFRALLAVFDVCASVGGGVRLHFSPVRRGRGAGVMCEVERQGDNVDMVVSALTGCPLLTPDSNGWMARLVPWRDATARRFLLAADVLETSSPQ